MKTYNSSIMATIRQRIGLDENDESKDEEIMEMDKETAFREYCLWNGLLGSWYYDLLCTVENIYGVELTTD